MLFNKLNDQIITTCFNVSTVFRKTWMEVQGLLSKSTPNINGVNSDSASIDYGVVKKSEITLDHLLFLFI